MKDRNDSPLFIIVEGDNNHVDINSEHASWKDLIPCLLVLAVLVVLLFCPKDILYILKEFIGLLG